MLLRPSAFLQAQVREEPLHVLNVNRLRSPRSLWRIIRAALWAKHAGFDVAHIFFNDSAIVFPILLNLLGIPVVVSRRDLGIWYTGSNLPILRIVARFVDAVIANCEAVRQAVISQEGFPAKRVFVIYNGVRRKVASVATIRREDFGVPDAASLIVLVANLRPLKRVGDAIRALPLIRKAVGEAHLLVVGEDRRGAVGDSHRFELETLATRLAVADQVHFAGKMGDPMPAIALADVCVLCSETEGLSNVVIEYMLAGKPVVATEVGGNAELVVDGETGILVAPGDASGLASAITAVLHAPVMAKSMGEAGWRRALELFAPSRMVAQHLNLYETLGRGLRDG